ncbi:hypothetical protein SPF06_20535 [Sinomonas sp. JGH33]|uniref:Integral membrane protein n=1 Tax=Sinomonas terricola TaxID=3110330 RepID=A0ABU5TBP2_9MICC|nr:hypothetical protein [Sinomonas sp. JGH33]MEA5457114.1 hypothetical protein [Sinomonas sp. JGH33]
MSILVASILAVWLLVLSRLGPCIRHRGDLVFFVALPAALAATINHPAVFRVVDTALGFPGVSSLLSGTLIMLAFGLFRSAIVKAVVAADKQEAVLRRGLLQTTAAITVFCVAFGCAAIEGAVSASLSPDRTSIDPASQSDIGVFVFMSTLCIYMIAVSIEVALVCVKYLPRMASALFRVGFGAVAIGCTVAVAALVAKLLRQIIVLTYVGLDYESFLQGTFDALQALCALFIAFGLMLPAMSGRVTAWQVYERYRLLRLHRLWRRTVVANVVIDSVSIPLKGVISRNPRARLHRALVEILDSDLAAGGTLLNSSDSKLVKKSEGALYA